MEKYKRWLKEIFKIIKTPNMLILPGNLAFFLMLSIIPIVTLIGFVSSLQGVSMDSVINFFSDTLPEEIIDTLVPFISGNGIDTNVVIFMIIGFFLASNGPHSIITTSNTLFEVGKDSYVKSRIKAIFMTIIMIFLLFFSLIILGFGNLILKTILNLKVFMGLNESIYSWFSLLKWPIAFILFFYMIKVIYTMALNKNISSKYMNRGSLFTTVCTILATFIYSYYVSHFADYDLFYGSLSNIMIMMVWIYIVSYVLVLGIAINAKTYKDSINRK